ncbi:unnamed protein product [Clonostachys rosea]|uniref:VOC domain-containing protein n=1 Tax=Bionectria ochroleuca TaxID=29856 RepID=A0ABY6UNR1_BIOOC|nr:unnamed protein product [Clonostachys rosea]
MTYRESSDEYAVGMQIPGSLTMNPPVAENDPTVSYRLNHFMLRIRDPKPTMHFYIDLMGMRTIFITNIGPITVYYLGYPQTAAHRADPAAFARETMPQPTMSSISGLLELCHYHESENQVDSYIVPGHKPPCLGFNHLGFTVPDVNAAVERLRTAGVKVVKNVGEGPNDSIPSTQWERQTLGIATDDIDSGFAHILSQIAFYVSTLARSV